MPRRRGFSKTSKPWKCGVHVRFEFDRRFAVLLQGSVFDVAGGPSEDENRGSERGEYRGLQYIGAY